MKTVFLDIDGVLDNEDTDFELDERMIYRLSKIVHTTNSNIVLISSWKKFFYKRENNLMPYIKSESGVTLYNKLLDHDLYITDKTDDSNTSRENSIINYIKENNINNYVILDDEDVLYKNKNLRKHLVLTTLNNKAIGLTDKNCEEAINILNKEKIRSK